MDPLTKTWVWLTRHILCKIGLHHWSPWLLHDQQNIGGAKLEHYVRECYRCGIPDTRLKIKEHP